MWHWLALWFLLLRCLAVADDKEPTVNKKTFESQTTEILYFDDSDIVLTSDLESETIYRSSDGGVSWDSVEDIPKGKAGLIVMNPSHNEVAIALGREKTHWITHDRGKSWKSFETDLHPQGLGVPTISFHSEDPKKVIMNLADPRSSKAIYTTDGFETAHTLHEKAIQCMWAKDNILVDTGSNSKNDKRAICLVDGKYDSSAGSQRLVISDDYFDDDEFEPEMDDGNSSKTISGFSRMAAVKGYIVAAQKPAKGSDMAFYVTKDTNNWHKAYFGDNPIEENAFTVLESTNYSLQVDVMVVKPDPMADNQMGALFTSDSNGTYFTRNALYTNRNRRGYVDFEKVQNIQGIILVNVVENHAEVLETGFGKRVVSKISFDDGRTLHDMKADGEVLHLHSVTDQSNSGRVFSSAAPGLVMGVGNTGRFLMPYSQGDLYVSDDAGMTWNRALKGPHKYEFGDSGSILIAISDGEETDKLKYSLDHGQEWKSIDLEASVLPQVLTTVPDSTSLKFLLMATSGKGSDTKHSIYSIDFKGLHEDTCEDDDFENWYPRLDSNGEPGCIMGHTQKFRRRKKNAKCFVKDEFRDPVPQSESCRCQDADFECDWGFVPHENGKECVPDSARLSPPKSCKDSKDTWKGPSGYRLIPGNDCSRKDGKQKDDEIERPCDTSSNPPDNGGSSDGRVSTEFTRFEASGFADYFYFEHWIKKNEELDRQETIVALTTEAEIYLSFNHGKDWSQPKELRGERIMAIYPHQFTEEFFYLLTQSEKVYYSTDGGQEFRHFSAPSKFNKARLRILQFHPKNSGWLLWTGDSESGDVVVYYSTDNGEKWKELLKNVGTCEFMWRKEVREVSEKLIFCEHDVRDDGDRKKQLLASDDWFDHQDVVFDDMLRFATMAEFVLVAKRDEDDHDNLRIEASVDAKIFAQAKFPHKFDPKHKTGYTALDSSTHAVFLHVTVNSHPDQEYGNIVKSNRNGTYYVMSIEGVNRNALGYADFEKMQGLEGVAMVNVVDNMADVDSGAPKKLKTLITHNDGADWASLPPPDKDADGHSYDCSGSDCSLHLHSFTERVDPRDTFSSPSAVGLMMGVGNVGKQLASAKDGDTFITRDGGLTWNEVMKGRFMWEYGDQGSIIVIVEEFRDTNVLYYTTDEGQNWTKYKFADRAIRVLDLTTTPSDTSRNFIIWGQDGSQAAAVNVDFTGLTSRQCKLDEKDPKSSDSDYTIFEPRHPKQDENCLFGHKEQYYRKKTDSNCYNGFNVTRLKGIVKENCECRREDFECDYNYERQSDSTCKLVGDKPRDPASICKEDPTAKGYYAITGYRRIPMDTCSGGKELDHVGQYTACPGHEGEVVRERGGISGLGLFLAVIIPMIAAGLTGWWAWRRYQAGRLGQIRLGDVPSSRFDTSSPLVSYPVMAISAVAATVMAVPVVVGIVFRFVREKVSNLRGRSGYSASPYTSRGSFARSGGIYSRIPNDESDLLGEESDDEA